MFVKNTRFIIALLFIGKFLSLNGQGQGECVCSKYYSIQNKDLHEYFFASDKIKNNKIQTATIHTIETNVQNSFRYLESKFLFDTLGNISYISDYSERDEFHTTMDFVWNDSGRVIRTYAEEVWENTEIYLRPSPEITDYTYNQGGYLTKKKKRDRNGVIRPDSLSVYTRYFYDTKGRLIREYSYSNYGDSVFVYDQTIEHPNEFTSIGITSADGENWMKILSEFDSKKRLIKQTEYNYHDSMDVEEHIYVFVKDKLRKQIYKNGTRISFSLFSLCPEKNEAEEDYSYNDFGLLEKVIHRFEDVKCEMIINYQ